MFDTNKDGRLDWDEVWNKMAPIISRIRSKNFEWTAHHNIKANEFRAMCMEMFEVANHDKNATLSPDEFKAFRFFVIESLH